MDQKRKEKVNRKLRQIYNYGSKIITKKVLKSISFVYEIGEATENLPEKDFNRINKGCTMTKFALYKENEEFCSDTFEFTIPEDMLESIVIRVDIEYRRLMEKEKMLFNLKGRKFRYYRLLYEVASGEELSIDRKYFEEIPEEGQNNFIKMVENIALRVGE